MGRYPYTVLKNKRPGRRSPWDSPKRLSLSPTHTYWLREATPAVNPISEHACHTLWAGRDHTAQSSNLKSRTNTSVAPEKAPLRNAFDISSRGHDTSDPRRG
jgi:hypothetical protein